jgi:hypothetical protein
VHSNIIVEGAFFELAMHKKNALTTPFKPSQKATPIRKDA